MLSVETTSDVLTNMSALIQLLDLTANVLMDMQDLSVNTEGAQSLEML